MAGHEQDDLVTLKKLANIFGIAPKTICAWRLEQKDCPEKVDRLESVSAWRKWFEKHSDRAKATIEGRRDKEALQCEKLAIEIRTAQVKHDALVGSLTPTADVETFCVALGQTLRALMMKSRNDLPPILEGLTAAEIKTRLAKNEDEFFEAFDAAFQRFADQLDERRISEDVPEDRPAATVGVDAAKREGGQQRAKRKIRR